MFSLKVSAPSAAWALALHLLLSSSVCGAACPQTNDEWLKFRDAGAGAVTKTNLALGDGGEGTLDKMIRQIANVFASCPGAPGETSNLETFARSRKNGGTAGFQLGFNVPDPTYFQKTKAFTDVPDFLQTSEILEAMSNPGRIDEAVALIEKLNDSRPTDEKLIVFRYRSQHLTTPDESQVYGRVLVVVPASATQPIERWVQYGVPEAGQPKTRNLSVVAVVKNEIGGTDVYFKDHFRMYDADKIYLKARFDVTGVSDNCVNCHKSGVLPIFPAPGSFKAEDEGKLAAINKRFRTYGAPGYGGYVTPESQGPGLGPSDAGAVNARSVSFLQACTTGLNFPEPAKSLDSIKGAMNCAICHDGVDLGAINYPVNRVLLHSFVAGGKMPPRNALTPDERRGLVKCLEAEYFGPGGASSPGVLANWLRGL